MFLLSINSLYSQKTSEIPYLNSNLSMLDIDGLLGEKRLRNDYAELNSYENTDGSPYLNSEFMDGIIELKGDTAYRIPMRFNIYGIGIFEVGQRLDLMFNVMGQYQSPYQEQVANAGLKFHFNNLLTQEWAMGLGVGYRFNNGFNNGDAVIPYFQLNINSWQFGLSYDLNISKFDVATGGLGGPEFSLIYIFKKPEAVPMCPTCPTYL